MVAENYENLVNLNSTCSMLKIRLIRSNQLKHSGLFHGSIGMTSIPKHPGLTGWQEVCQRRNKVLFSEIY